MLGTGVNIARVCHTINMDLFFMTRDEARSCYLPFGVPRLGPRQLFSVYSRIASFGSHMDSKESCILLLKQRNSCG